MASTVLTLLIIPTIYALVDGMKARLTGRRVEATRDDEGFVGAPGTEAATT